MTDLPAKPVGIALIGCGRISTPHLKAITGQPDSGTLVAVADVDPARAAAVAAAYGAAHHAGSLEEILAIDAVEAVILCTPNAVHAAQVEQALRAGKHVLVEKPFSETVAEAERNAALAEERGLVLTVGHTFRHVEAVRVLQDRLPEYGRIRAVSIAMCVRWDGPQAPWWATRTEDEGLILSLFAPHAIDFLQMVVGDVDPIRITVEAARHQSGWQAEDEAMILLRYPGDVLASIHVSYNQRAMTNRKTVHCEGGTLRVENGDELWIDDQFVVSPAQAKHVGGPLLGDGITHYFATQFREFANRIAGLPSRSVRADEAVRQIRLNLDLVRQARR
jgi:predicted dehydrogenase